MKALATLAIILFLTCALYGCSYELEYRKEISPGVCKDHTVFRIIYIPIMADDSPTECAKTHG